MIHTSALVSILICLVNFFLGGSANVKEGHNNHWPIVGVFTQPTTSDKGNCGGDCLYLAASYVNCEAVKCV